jgi:hypothetical protein
MNFGFDLPYDTTLHDHLSIQSDNAKSTKKALKSAHLSAIKL